MSLEVPVDPRSDLFSLGVVRFEGFAGTRPLDGATEWSTRMNIVAGRSNDLRALAPSAPEPLVKIVESLIPHQIEARLRSAEVLLHALEELPANWNAKRSMAAAVRGVMAEAKSEEAEPTLVETASKLGWSK